MNVAAGTIVVLLFAGPIGFSASGIAMFAVVLPLAFVVDFLGYFAIGLSAFWLESTAGLTLIYSRVTMLLGGMLMPLDVFPEAFQPIVRALPFASIVYGPSRLFVTGNPDAFRYTLTAQVAALILFGAVVWTIQRVALKHIQNNGG